MLITETSTTLTFGGTEKRLPEGIVEIRIKFGQMALRPDGAAPSA